MQAILRWKLAKWETGLLTVAHLEQVAGLLDRVKHLEAVAKEQLPPKLWFAGRLGTADDTPNEPINTQDRPAFACPYGESCN
jgi:hypothetical protein